LISLLRLLSLKLLRIHWRLHYSRINSWIVLWMLLLLLLRFILIWKISRILLLRLLRRILLRYFILGGIESWLSLRRQLLLNLHLGWIWMTSRRNSRRSIYTLAILSAHLRYSSRRITLWVLRNLVHVWIWRHEIWWRLLRVSLVLLWIILRVRLVKWMRFLLSYSDFDAFIDLL